MGATAAETVAQELVGGELPSADLYAPFLVFDKPCALIPANCRQRLNLRVCAHHPIFYSAVVSCRTSTSPPPPAVVAAAQRSALAEVHANAIPCRELIPPQLTRRGMAPRLETCLRLNVFGFARAGRRLGRRGVPVARGRRGHAVVPDRRDGRVPAGACSGGGPVGWPSALHRPSRVSSLGCAAPRGAVSFSYGRAALQLSFVDARSDGVSSSALWSECSLSEMNAELGPPHACKPHVRKPHTRKARPRVDRHTAHDA